MDLDIRGQRIPLGSVAGWLGAEGAVEGAASFTGGLRGPLHAPRGSWALGLAGVRVVGRVLGDGSATVDLDQGAFTARDVSFTGGLGGELHWAVGRRRVEGELSWPGLPVAVLAEAATGLLGEQCDVRAGFVWPVGEAVTGELVADGEGLHVLVVADEVAVEAEARLGEAIVTSVVLDREPGGGLRGSGQLRLAALDDVMARLLPEARVPLRGTGRVDYSVSWVPGDWPEVTGTVESLDLELEDRPVRLLNQPPSPCPRPGRRWRACSSVCSVTRSSCAGVSARTAPCTEM